MVWPSMRHARNPGRPWPRMLGHLGDQVNLHWGVYVTAALVYSPRSSDVLDPQCLCWSERPHMRFSCVKCWPRAVHLVHSLMKRNRAIVGEAITGVRSRTRLEQYDVNQLQQCVG